MERNSAGLDESIKDRVKRYPTADLIRRLFPDVKMRGRASLCNPLRDDRHPSMSLYVGRDGYPKWKDYATGEFGDNIDFFQKAYPEYTYDQAVDKLAWMLLGMSAYQDPSSKDLTLPQRNRLPVSQRVRIPAPEPDPVLKIVCNEPLCPATASPDLVSYWRGRGISDIVALSLGRRVVVENGNRKGRVLRDRESGLPIVEKDGTPVLDDGLFEAVGFRNDIGGFSLRVPETKEHDGFKGCDKAFISTVYADGSSPRGLVSFVGEGDGRIQFFRYDESSRYLQVNPSQGFVGVEPYAVRFALPFLNTWSGRFLEGRDRRGAVAVLDALNGPVNTVATLVEGPFDAFSVAELNMMSGGVGPGTDLVVLNSVSNLFWAIPFLSMHMEVRSLLDNDLKSGAGQRTYSVLEKNVAAYCASCGGICNVRSDSSLIYPYKDVNDYLKFRKGFRSSVAPAQPDEKKKEDVVTPVAEPVRSRRRRHGRGV